LFQNEKKAFAETPEKIQLAKKEERRLVVEPYFTQQQRCIYQRAEIKENLIPSSFVLLSSELKRLLVVVVTRERERKIKTTKTTTIIVSVIIRYLKLLFMLQ
jgi:hypothetical protein